MHTLLGHAKRAFSVLWSLLLPELLLSGSDDATARVWDTHSGSCVALLAGHKADVRALCWHPELPWLVLTGRLLSWHAIVSRLCVAGMPAADRVLMRACTWPRLVYLVPRQLGFHNPMLGLAESGSNLHLHAAPQRRVWTQHPQQLPMAAGVCKQGLYIEAVEPQQPNSG